MDTLPPELLGMIADSVQEDPLPFQGQCRLAALARTNKIFHSICNARLYKSPILGSAKMSTKWARFYFSKVNPWTLSTTRPTFQDVTVPESITFTDDGSNARQFFWRFTDPPNEYRLLTVAFRPNFFRNLTSFSISNYDQLDDYFLATIFAPLATARTTIRRLEIILDERWALVSFLLEASNRMVWYLPEEDLIYIAEAILYGPVDDRTRDVLNTFLEEEDPRTLSAADFQHVRKTALERAPFDYSIFTWMGLGTNGVEEVLPSIHHTIDNPCHPFASLRSLTLSIEDSDQIYLIFYSRLFPVLETSKLVGYMRPTANLEHDIKLLRHSITESEGQILPPSYDDTLNARTESYLRNWSPLKREEIESKPKIVYSGPNLSVLDLSEFWIGS